MRPENRIDRSVSNPDFKLRSPLPWRSHNDPFTELAETHGTYEQRVKVLRGNPRLNLRLRLGAHQLGRNVGVQQETAHSKSTGRAEEGARRKSVSTSSS